MVTSVIEAVLPAKVEQVWQVVTSLEEYTWRSDIKEVRQMDAMRFVEYTKAGFYTVFTVTAQSPGQRWAFHLDNPNLTGRWEGVFQAQGEQTLVRFTEWITPKKWYLRPFIKGFLKRQQARYMRDLRIALEQEKT